MFCVRACVRACVFLLSDLEISARSFSSFSSLSLTLIILLCEGRRDEVRRGEDRIGEVVKADSVD